MFPQKINATEGEIIDIYCLLKPPLSWFFNDSGKLPDNVLINNENGISINNANEMNTGVYECFGTDVNNYKIGSAAEVTVHSKLALCVGVPARKNKITPQ